MNKLSGRFLLCAACLASLIGPARAGAIWTLENVMFDDGTVATGSFEYDAGSDTYSNWNINVETAVFMPAYTYLPGVDGGFIGIHSATQVDFVAFPPSPPTGRYVRLVFNEPLTDAGGIDSLGFGPPPLNPYEVDNSGGNFRFIVSGEVVTQAQAPEPATYALIGVAFAGVVLTRRKLSYVYPAVV